MNTYIQTIAQSYLRAIWIYNLICCQVNITVCLLEHFKTDFYQILNYVINTLLMLIMYQKTNSRAGHRKPLLTSSCRASPSGEEVSVGGRIGSASLNPQVSSLCGALRGEATCVGSPTQTKRKHVGYGGPCWLQHQFFHLLAVWLLGAPSCEEKMETLQFGDFC